MLYRAYQFNGLTLPTAYGSSGFFDLSGGKVNTDWVTIAGGRVWDALRTDRAKTGLSTFGVECGLKEANAAALKTAFDALMAKKGIGGSLTRIDAASVTHSITARLANVDAKGAPGHRLRWQPVTLTFETGEQCWAGTARPGGPVTITGSEGDQTIVNSGNAPWPRPIFTLTAGTGSVTTFNFGASSGTHVWWWSWIGVLDAGNALVIDCGAMRITNDGIADYGLSLSAGHIENEWVSVPNGNLTFHLAGLAHSGTDPTLSWVSYDGWR